MKHTLTLLLAGFFLATAMPARAQEGDTGTPGMDKKELEPTPVGKWYWSNGLDAAIFSTSRFERPALKESWTTLRFSYFVNFGFNFNYDFDNHFGMFTGLGIKNIGLIDKIGDSTIKRRVYTIGAPLGFKLGNLQKRNFGFIGGGIDVPFNYREKGFRERRDKHKMSDWFSDRTEKFMPYVFAGMSFNPGVTVKAQYYPGNFFNTEFQDGTTMAGQPNYPYKGYEAHILYLSIGFDIHYKKKPKEKADDNDTNEM